MILSLSAARNIELTTNGTNHEQAKHPAQITNHIICDPKAQKQTT
jgi:hypothetical protein